MISHHTKKSIAEEWGSDCDGLMRDVREIQLIRWLVLFSMLTCSSTMRAAWRIVRLWVLPDTEEGGA